MQAISNLAELTTQELNTLKDHLKSEIDSDASDNATLLQYQAVCRELATRKESA